MDGELVSLNYGKISSLALDPIEKKPLNRYKPGTMILSGGSFGCNLSCDFCQNFSIAQGNPQTVEIQPEEFVDRALPLRQYGNIGLAFTYNEPSVWFEYVYDCAVLAKAKGLDTVLVTNGYINSEPLDELLPFISAMNIDLKGDTRFYRELCKAAISTGAAAKADAEVSAGAAVGSDASAGADAVVKATIKKAHRYCHVEITTLVVPGWNDNIDFIRETADWIASVSDEIPLHLSRFFPRHRMSDSLPTDIEFLLRAAEVASRSLKYVYTGNM